MAAPIVPIIKKVATVVVSNKKLRNTAIGIILGFVFILMMPVLFLVGFFSDDYQIDLTEVEEVIEEYEDEAEDIWDDIEVKMDELEISGLKKEEAKILLTMALFDKRNDKNFAEDFAGCFEKDQSDKELIDNINSKFKTDIDDKQFTDVVSGVRNAYIDPSFLINPTMKNNTDLVLWANNAVAKKWGYVNYTYGNVLDKKAMAELIMEHSFEITPYVSIINEKWLGTRTVDAVGLIKSYAWYDIQTNLINPNTNGISDVTAEELYTIATQKGLIENIPEVPGIAVYENGHIGIYIGNGKVIEAKDLLQGVVQADLSQGTWTEWFYIPSINYN